MKGDAQETFSFRKLNNNNDNYYYYRECMHVCRGVQVEVRGQLLGVISHLPLFEAGSLLFLVRCCVLQASWSQGFQMASPPMLPQECWGYTCIPLHLNFYVSTVNWTYIIKQAPINLI